MMSVAGIQGQMLEVTVVGCSRLKDTEWISRQDPYVCLEYGSTKFRTRTCKDGNKNPTFQEKFLFPLVEGLREINVAVWNSNTLTRDDFIGNGRIQIQKVLSQGFDDTAWTIQSKSGRYAGEVRLIMHYSNANKPMTTSYAPSAPQYYAAPPPPQVPLYSAPPPAAASAPHPPAMSSFTTPSSYASYPSVYPPSSYPPPPSAYPPQSYPPQTYPPQPYPPQTYPPQQSYPPNSYQTYPPRY